MRVLVYWADENTKIAGGPKILVFVENTGSLSFFRRVNCDAVLSIVRAPLNPPIPCILSTRFIRRCLWSQFCMLENPKYVLTERCMCNNEFMCIAHWCSSSVGDRRHDYHNRQNPWKFLRLYWAAWPNMPVNESIYMWRTMIRHLRGRTKMQVPFEREKCPDRGSAQVQNTPSFWYMARLPVHKRGFGWILDTFRY